MKDDYRLVRVLECHPGEDGLVRTVTVGYRRRDIRNTQKVAADPSQYEATPLVKEKVHVQRLAVLQNLHPEENIEKMKHAQLEKV